MRLKCDQMIKIQNGGPALLSCRLLSDPDKPFPERAHAARAERIDIAFTCQRFVGGDGEDKDQNACDIAKDAGDPC